MRRREWTFRFIRFGRARLRSLCAKGLLLADEPRIIQAWRRGWDEEHFVRLRRWHDEGFRPSCIYDIGAHAGSWSEMCQAIFAPRQCFLFEPQPQLQAKAREKQALSGGNWQVVPVALGDQAGENTLYVTRNRAASSLLEPMETGLPAEWGTKAERQEKVGTGRLDELAAAEHWPVPDLVKIDVQGYEEKVLAGGQQTLGQSQRMVVETSLRELYHGQSLLPRLIDMLTSWGYRVEDINEAGRQWPGGRLWQVDLWLKRDRDQ